MFLADSIHTRFEGVADVRFTSSRKEGRTFISLRDVPMTELERLTQALQDGNGRRAPPRAAGAAHRRAR
ncbi:hypothetical protein [Archangium sp.]|uniref:hypothetical protein n=1 Tax=Archangium sp. TaxID=1872627 RepID=UPI002D754D77|nr:hypothetical protein [Archangium sp.]HYO57963.1 hypothetical protein [Archangium sp.]